MRLNRALAGGCQRTIANSSNSLAARSLAVALTAPTICPSSPFLAQTRTRESSRSCTRIRIFEPKVYCRLPIVNWVTCTCWIEKMPCTILITTAEKQACAKLPPHFKNSLTGLLYKTNNQQAGVRVATDIRQHDVRENRMLQLIALAVIWYILCEVWINNIRKPQSMPGPLSFWIGIAQSIGSALLVASAVWLTFFSKK